MWLIRIRDLLSVQPLLLHEGRQLGAADALVGVAALVAASVILHIRASHHTARAITTIVYRVVNVGIVLILRAVTSHGLASSLDACQVRRHQRFD